MCNTGTKSKSKSIAAATSEIANWRLVEGGCTTEERPLAAQFNNKKLFLRKSEEKTCKNLWQLKHNKENKANTHSHTF